MEDRLKNIFLEIHSDIPREGPGDPLSTAKAFKMVPNLSGRPMILDVGCGPGAQTLDLVKMTYGTVVAVDNHQPYLDRLEEKVRRAGYAERVWIVNEDMHHLDFEPGTFDLIWSEGAIYIIGFGKGIRAWKKMLKPGGCIAVSELTWLTETPPRPAAEFWAENYPTMKTVEGNLAEIEAAGYRLLGHFTLPPSSWWESYYLRLEKRLTSFRERYAEDAEVLALIDAEQAEIDLFRRYGKSYGYVFYVMRSPE